MGFNVNFDSLDAMYTSIYSQSGKWLSALETLSNATTALAESSEMAGTGADAIRSYMSSVHGMMQGLIAQMIQLHEKNNLLYKNDYQQNIDTSLHAVIKQSELDSLHQSLSRQNSQAIEVDGELRYAMGRIQDIFTLYYNDITNVDQTHTAAMNFLTGLDDAIQDLESRHTGSDFTNTGDMITHLTAMIQELLTKDRNYKSDFSMEALAGSEKFRNLYDSYVKVSKECEDKASAIETALENENQRIADLQAEYEQRQKEAQAAKWIVTGLCVIGSIVAIAATGGAATPLVVGAVSAASSAVIAGTNNLADSYVEHGNLENVDWGSFGKDVVVGAATGFVTGYVGAGVGGAITSGLSKTAAGAALLNSSNTLVRVGTGAVIGSVSEVGSGIVSRGAGTYIASGGDLEEALDAAFDGNQIVSDAVIGGASGGYGEFQKMNTKGIPDDDFAHQDNIDWENTSNTPEELSQIREMDEAGDFVFEETRHGKQYQQDYGTVESTTDFTDPKTPGRHLPTEKSGTIVGDRDSGNFDFTPNNKTAQKTMEQYGETSISYKNGEPNFSPYTKHKTEWGNVECEVQIESMSGNRTGSSGNYTQADESLARKISSETGKPVTAADVKTYRENSGLTWHETNDGYTMQLIPTEINASCPHRGGTSIRAEQQAWGDISHYYD